MSDPDEGPLAKILSFGDHVRKKLVNVVPPPSAPTPRGLWEELTEVLQMDGTAYSTTFNGDCVTVAWNEDDGRAATSFNQHTGAPWE